MFKLQTFLWVSEDYFYYWIEFTKLSVYQIFHLFKNVRPSLLFSKFISPKLEKINLNYPFFIAKSKFENQQEATLFYYNWKTLHWWKVTWSSPQKVLICSNSLITESKLIIFTCNINSSKYCLLTNLIWYIFLCLRINLHENCWLLFAIPTK